jgi:hypothetical protein
LDMDIKPLTDELDLGAKGKLKQQGNW